MVFVLVVIMLVVVAQNPHEVLLSMAVAYALSGPLMWVYKKQPAKTAQVKVPTKNLATKASSSKKARTSKPKTEKAKTKTPKDEESS
jgi:hypothetical protein